MVLPRSETRRGQDALAEVKPGETVMREGQLREVTMVVPEGGQR